MKQNTIFATKISTHLSPEPQSIFMTCEGTLNGTPALTEACLAGFCPCPAVRA